MSAPREFPRAPEPETSLPMWLYWLFVAVLVGAVTVTVLL